MLPFSTPNMAFNIAAKAPVFFDTLSLKENCCAAESTETFIKRTQSGADCSIYYGRWDNDDEREEFLVKRVSIDRQCYDELCRALGTWGVRLWNGFCESNPEVLDGERFDLTISENGKSISACGTNAYPENYHSFTSALQKLFE